VHSYEHMRAAVALGGKSLSQYSQFGRSCSAMGTSIIIRISGRTVEQHPDLPKTARYQFRTTFICTAVLGLSWIVWKITQ
jgi:hypothetical protein